MHDLINRLKPKALVVNDRFGENPTISLKVLRDNVAYYQNGFDALSPIFDVISIDKTEEQKAYSALKGACTDSTELKSKHIGNITRVGSSRTISAAQMKVLTTQYPTLALLDKDVIKNVLMMASTT